MTQVNLYRDKQNGEWGMGTPLETWYYNRRPYHFGRIYPGSFLFKLRVREIIYRYRPLGQDRGFGKGLMGLMGDEGNYHATEVKPLDINYEKALDQLVDKFLSALKDGQIKTCQNLKNFFHFSAIWKDGMEIYVGVGNDQKETLQNLKETIITHIQKLKENKEYRDFHLNEGGPTVELFPHLNAQLNARIKRRRRKSELILY